MKQILYISNCCSKTYFYQLYSTAKEKPSQAPQRYHSLMTEGLMQNNFSVTCLTGRPVTTASHGDFLWRTIKEEKDGIRYIYLPFLNNPYLKALSFFLTAFIITLIWGIRTHRKGAVVTDILCIPHASGASLAARMMGISVNGIVTDLPDMIDFGHKDSSLRKKISKAFLYLPTRLCTHLTMLTKYMGEVINQSGKPYIIVEGLVDSRMQTAEKYCPSDGKRHICYTGQIYEEFGVRNLLEAFMQTACNDAILDIYGPGPLAEDMITYTKKDPRIVYHGCVAMEEAVKAQLGAYLLVNPRPTSDIFTRYSFPSKNMEYMASGTAMLTTKLLGIPKEYYPYLFLIDGDSVDAICQSLQSVLHLPQADVVSRGEAAKKYVMTEKNHIVQARKVCDLLF